MLALCTHGSRLVVTTWSFGRFLSSFFYQHGAIRSRARSVEHEQQPACSEIADQGRDRSSE